MELRLIVDYYFALLDEQHLATMRVLVLNLPFLLKIADPYNLHPRHMAYLPHIWILAMLVRHRFVATKRLGLKLVLE
jgi:hypothetical protein